RLPSRFRMCLLLRVFFFQAEDGIRDRNVTGVQTCALPILPPAAAELDGEASGQVPDLAGLGAAAAVHASVGADRGAHAVAEVEEIGRASCRERGWGGGGAGGLQGGGGHAGGGSDACGDRGG